jgi:trimeric autotransporter adhesin
MSVEFVREESRVRRPARYLGTLLASLLAALTILSVTPAAAQTDEFPLYGSLPVPADHVLASSLESLKIEDGNSQSTTVGGSFSGLRLRACGTPTPTTFVITDTTSCPVQSTFTVASDSGVEIRDLPVTFEVQDLSQGTGLATATATFNGSGSTYIGSTNSNGTLTTPNLTAGTVAGPVIIEATATLPNGSTESATFVLTVEATGADGLEISSPISNDQTIEVGADFPADLSVTVVDRYGNAVGAGQSVTFTANANGTTGATAQLNGSSSPVTVVTNDSGEARVTATAASGIGDFTVTASASSLPGTAFPTSVNFDLTNVAPATAIEKLAGDGQDAIISTKFANSLQVFVKDDFDTGVGAVTVTFTIVPGGSGASGAFERVSGEDGAQVQTIMVRPTSSDAGTLGIATAPDITANGVAGDFTVTATFEDVNGTTIGLSAPFTLTNVGADDIAFTIQEGVGQTTPIHTNFRTRLKVLATVGGTPLPDALLTFSAPASGATGIFINGQSNEQSVYTDENGVAEASVFRANGTTGTYDVTVSLAGTTGGNTATFSLTNSNGAPAAATSAYDAGEPSTLAVSVTDTGGTPLDGVSVEFRLFRLTGESGGLTISDPLSTDSSPTSLTVVTGNGGDTGIAEALAAVTTGAQPGTYRAVAYVDGFGTPVEFLLEIDDQGNLLVGAPSEGGGTGVSGAGLHAVSAQDLSAVIGSVYSDESQNSVFTVRAVDAQGNGLNGVDVTFTVVPSGGANGEFSGGATTATVTTAANSPDGYAVSPSFEANGVIGDYTVTAEATIDSVVHVVTFTLSNTAGEPDDIAIVSGDNQTTPRSAAFAQPLVVLVTSGGTPVANQEVIFFAPEPLLDPNSTVVQPSGTFSGGLNWESVTTDASGIATSSTFTANSAFGSYQVSATVADNTTLTATFTLMNDYSDDFVRDRTTRVIKNFMVRRGEQITSSEPDLSRRLTRDPASASQNGGVQFAGNGDDQASTMTVAASLYGIFEAQKQRKVANANALAPAMGLGADDFFEGQEKKRSGLDVWVEGKWSRIDQDDAESESALFYVGVDYSFEGGLILGVMGQMDYTTETDFVGQLGALDRVEAEGTGWLVGPYMVARLHQNLLFDARAAWGQSDNEVDPLGLYKDSFDGERWLAKGQLTGDFRYGSLHFAPHVGVIYFEETQKAYTDSLGVDIPEQTVSLGRMTFGPKIEARSVMANGTIVAPYVSVKGIWDFTSDDEVVNVVSGAEIAASSEDLRARTEGGLAIVFPGGTSLSGEGFLDGLGTDEFTAYGGSARLNIPLH